MEATQNSQDTVENSFRVLIETNADGVIVVSNDGIIRYVNHAAEELFGRKAVSLLGEDIGYPVVAGEKRAEGFFAFPRGPIAGTCIHRIFEILDFSLQDVSKAKAQIQHTLKEFNLYEVPEEAGPESGQVNLVYNGTGRIG